jgi:hypothetical protein
MLKLVTGALRESTRLHALTGRHVDPRSKASPKRLPKAIGGLLVAITS